MMCRAACAGDAVMKAATVALLALLVLLVGCATTAHRGEAPLDEFLPYAAAPVDEFHFFTLDGWQRAGKDHVVLWVDVNHAYLVAVLEPCLELDFTEYLGVSSTLRTVSRFESLFPGRHDRCPITEIRPLDVKRLNADRAAARAAAKAGAER
jgi:hypothetical protein